MAGLGRRRAGLLRRGLTVGAVATVVALGGCGDDKGDGVAAESARAKAVDAQVRAKLMATGERVFDEHCHSCHTLLGRRNPPLTNGEPAGTNFDEVTMRAPYVRERVEGGGRAMASFSEELSPLELRAIVAYVTDVAGRDVDSTEADGSAAELAEGKRVFADVCQACHTLADVRYTGPLEEHGMNFNGVKPSARLVLRAVRKGTFYMAPVGERLSDAEIRAVVKYVVSAAGEGGKTEL